MSTSAAPIHPATRIGAVHLTVSDLARSVAFYRDRLGFAVRSATDDTARLHAGGDDLLVLHGSPDAPRPRRATGLYHFAIRVPSRAALAEALRHLLVTSTVLTGEADHGVSEAIYLPDPDDIGIEIYRDRPPEEWPREDGRLRMISDPIDIAGLLAEASAERDAWTGLPAGTTIGHVHLHVSRVEDAARFYVDALGFEMMQRLGDSAGFVSAGGYHHHVAFNTWHGIGAPPPPPGAIGLEHFEVTLPERGELDRIVARARAAGVTVEEGADGAALADPSANRLLLAAHQ